MSQDLLEYWYDALKQPVGLILRTSDVEALKQRLYAARRAASDPRLIDLTLATSPDFPESELWIVRKGAEPDGEKS